MFRPRLYKSSIAVGLIVALLLVLIEIPGRVVSGVGGTNVSKVFEHGWPWIYLRRETAQRYVPASVTTPEGLSIVPSFNPVIHPLDVRTDLPRWGIPWLSGENWRFWQSDTSAAPAHWGFNSVTLFCDTAVAVCALVAAVIAWETWRRLRPNPLRFGLIEMFVGIAAVSAALGCLAHLKHEHKLEAQLIQRVMDETGPMEGTWFDNDQVCLAPTWVRSLVGERFLPGYFWRTCAVEIQPDRGQNTDFFCGQISQLAYVREVALEGDPRHRFRFSALRILEHLHTLQIWTYRTIDEKDVSELAHLKQLKKVVIDNKDEIAPHVLSLLAAELPDCKIMDAYEDW